MKKKHAYGIRWAAVFLTALLACLHGAAPQAAIRAPLAAQLKGFAPHAKISYAIESAQGILTQGAGTAGKDGSFSILSPEKIPYEALPVRYGIEILEPGDEDPLRLSVTMHPGDRGLSLTAKGLQPFSKLETQGAFSGLAEARSDWAGILQKNAAGSLEDMVRPQGFQVAFLSGRMNDAHSAPDARIILVQAPTLGCPPGATTPQISICQPSQTQQLGENLKKNFTEQAQSMTRQLSVVMMQQMAILGKFFDAKQQLETQRLHQQLVARAHKDYQPSAQMCEFGSFMRSLPKAEEKTQIQKAALNKGLLIDYTGREDASTGLGRTDDRNTRIAQFLRNYCNPKDNDGTLSLLCKEASGAGVKPERQNLDIDYARLVGLPLTIDADFASSGTGAEGESEEDLFALGRNLYWPDAFDPIQDPAGQYAPFLNIRRLTAMIGVAHNSYANIVAMKTKETPPSGKPGGADFMKAMLKELGLSAEEADEMLGKNPSYYAQMEILTKKIYQSPDFYTNLYDKPANVDRIGVSVDAIKLMQNRDLYKSALRREMLTSLMVEAALTSHGTSSDTTRSGGASPAESANPF